MTARGGRKPSLDGCRAKLRRASDHIGLLDAHINRGTRPVPLRIGRELDPKGERLRVSVEVVSIEPFPDDWSVLLGDAIQNIRAALDYLVYELIAVETGTHWEDSQFPVAKSEDRHAGWRDKGTIERLEVHWPVIRRYQPYGGSDPPSLHDLLFDFLTIFSNQDKHRLLVPVSASLNLNASTLPIYPGQGVRRIGVPWLNVGVLEPGATLTCEEFLVIGPDPQVHLSGSYTPTICFREIPTLSVGDVLSMMHGKTASLVSEFESFF